MSQHYLRHLRRKARLFAAAWALVGWGPVVVGQDAQAVLEGMIHDVNGWPVSGFRAIVRRADGNDVFVSPPSAEDGSYAMAVPSGASLLIVAAVAPTGARTAIQSVPELETVQGKVRQDIRVLVSTAPGPRHGTKGLEGSDRLFLSFVEDPLLVHRMRLEVQTDGATSDASDRLGTGVIAAVQLRSLPRLEFGGRVGLVAVDTGTGLSEDSGATDVETWGKFQLVRSASGKLELAAGGLFTLPTGDDTDGLGQDAIQSKLFVAGSYALSSAVLVAHVGLRASEDGRVGGVVADGTVSPTAAAGAVVPFSSKLSLIFEASYEGERFEGYDADSMVLFGVNWRYHARGTLRAAVAGGLTDTSPDVQVLVGYAREY